MARYVDIDEVKQAWAKQAPLTYQLIKDDLDKFPTADVVEVVRCKECNYIVRSGGVCRLLSNNYEPPVYVEDDDFCSRGKRRGDEKTQSDHS